MTTIIMKLIYKNRLKLFIIFINVKFLYNFFLVLFWFEFVIKNRRMKIF